MHFVGIDLAWGERSPTGLAVLDESAHLLHVSAVRTDDQVQAALGPYVAGPCLVGIDAPLVVTNPTGSRPAEKALSADFRRFDAGTHPANTGKREFAEGTRGARVAKRLGLDMDPRSGRERRAIEVYPHAASIVLFGLSKILRYKNKQGRDLDLLRSELLVLMTHLESIVGVDDTWAGLRSQVENAGRKSELRVVEDQVDAVVCAYVALYSARWPELTTTYGDAATGAIVTPALGSPALGSPAPGGPAPDGPAVGGPAPDGSVAGDPVGGPVPAQEPTSGAPGLAPATQADRARIAVQQYAARHPDLVLAGEEAVRLVQGVLDEAGINYLSITGRTKTVASFAEKASRADGGVPLYPEPATQITDVIGVRVITYVGSDVEAVAGLLGDQVVVRDDRDLGQETASEGRFGYASRHLLISLDAARESHPDFAHLRGLVAQVQLRTVLQHAWAEFEHDIRYKGSVPAEHAREFDRRFTLAAGLLELADTEFATIRERLRGLAPEPTSVADDDPRIDARELAAFLAGQYSDAGWSRVDHYGWISGLLLELGITSLVELGEVLREAPTDLNERMDYRYPPGAVRRLDDALLATYGRRFVDLHGNAHRREALAARLERLTDESG